MTSRAIGRSPHGRHVRLSIAPSVEACSAVQGKTGRSMKWLMIIAILCVPGTAMADTCGGQIAPAFARNFADEWIASWNSHDLSRILEHYSDDFEMHSPGIIAISGEPSGMLKGKVAVAAYWEKALKAPGLTYELVDVFAGVGSLAIHWRRPGREVVEIMELNAKCKVTRANVLVRP